VNLPGSGGAGADRPGVRLYFPTYRRHIQKPIMNLDEIKLETQKQGEAFEAKMGAIGIHLGARKLGYRLTIVPPGKKAWPYHNHYVNGEMFVILEGAGFSVMVIRSSPCASEMNLNSLAWAARGERGRSAP
jgi:hypothetical protein